MEVARERSREAVRRAFSARPLDLEGLLIIANRVRLDGGWQAATSRTPPFRRTYRGRVDRSVVMIELISKGDGFDGGFAANESIIMAGVRHPGLRSPLGYRFTVHVTDMEDPSLKLGEMVFDGQHRNADLGFQRPRRRLFALCVGIDQALDALPNDPAKARGLEWARRLIREAIR